jgi:hypothetical protein
MGLDRIIEDVGAGQPAPTGIAEYQALANSARIAATTVS